MDMYWTLSLTKNEEKGNCWVTCSGTVLYMPTLAIRWCSSLCSTLGWQSLSVNGTLFVTGKFSNLFRAVGQNNASWSNVDWCFWPDCCHCPFSPLILSPCHDTHHSCHFLLIIHMQPTTESLRYQNAIVGWVSWDHTFDLRYLTPASVPLNVAWTFCRPGLSQIQFWT